jgi:hypothetical protein
MPLLSWPKGYHVDVAKATEQLSILNERTFRRLLRHRAFHPMMRTKDVESRRQAFAVWNRFNVLPVFSQVHMDVRMAGQNRNHSLPGNLEV